MVAEIRELATWRYVTEQQNRVAFGPDGDVAFRWERRYESFSEDELQELEQWAMERYGRFVDLLDELADTFATYYELGPPWLVESQASRLDVEQSLAIDWADEELGFDDIIRRELEVAPRTVYDRLHVADVIWVQPVKEMITAELWDGDAAEQFLKEFIAPFGVAKGLQMGCTKVLAIVAYALHAAVGRTQDDLRSIAGECIAKLIDPGGGLSDAEHLGVGSIIAGAVGLLLPTGASQAAGLISIGAGIASLFAESAVDEQEWTWQIRTVDHPGGDHAGGGGVGAWPSNPGTRLRYPGAGEYSTAWTIVESTLDVLSLALAPCLQSQDQRIADALKTSVIESSEALDNPKIDLERPDIANDPEALGDQRYDPGDASDVIVANIADVYRAGWQNLPGAAAQYETAAASLDGCVVPDWLATHFPATVSKFDEARTTLTDILSRTRDSLAGSGENLVDAARGYDFTEDESANALARFTGIRSWESEAGQRGWDLVPPPPPPGEDA